MSITARAAFTAADDTLLTAYTPDLGAMSRHTTYSANASATITGNRARCSANSTVQAWVITTDPGADDYQVDFDLYPASLVGGLSLLIACSTAAFTNYAWVWNGTSFGLFRWVNNAFNDLSVSYTPTGLTAGVTERFSVRRTIPDASTVRVQLLRNGVQVATYDDTSASRITARNRGGFSWFQTTSGASVGLQIDTVVVRDVVTNASYAVSESALHWTDNTVRLFSGQAIANNPGTILKTNFTGTSIGINVDVSALVAASITSTKYPYIQWKVDGGAWSTPRLLTASDSTITLESGLAGGSHSLQLAFRTLYADYDRWNVPIGAVVITGIVLDSAQTVSTPTLEPRRMLWFGDSNSEGAEVNGAVNSPADTLNSDALSAPGNFVAADLHCELSLVGFGSQGWITTVANANLPDLEDAWDFYYSGASRLSSGELEGPPDFIVLCHGQNDGSSIQAAIEATVPLMRTAAPDARIVLVVAPNQNRRADVLAAYATLSATDDRVHLVDTAVNYLDTGSIYRTNAFHLNALGAQTFADEITAAIALVDIPIITVQSPATGGIRLVGVEEDIEWHVDGLILDGVDILLSTDGGSTFPITLAEAVDADTPYPWTPQGSQVSATAVLKVVHSTDSDNFDNSDSFKVATTQRGGGVPRSRLVNAGAF